MDWYSESEMDDFLVPKDRELADRQPPFMDNWLNWGVNNFPENFRMSNKFLDGSFAQDELNFDGKCFCDEVDMETSFRDKDQSSGSSVCVLAACSHDWPDCQLNDPAGIGQMDDIFINSLFEDPPVSKNLHKSFCTSHESENGMMPDDSFLKDMVLDSQSTICDEHGMESSKYLNEHVYPSLFSWDKRDSTNSQSFPCNSGQTDFPPMQEYLLKGLASPEKNSENRNEDEETSLEESVLQELEMVMVQFTDKTRICLRDSFYRLANNSRQQHLATQSLNRNIFLEEHPQGTALGGTMRPGRKKPTESETNTIDRAIANLVFNKMESNGQGIPHTAIANFEQEVFKQNKHRTTFPADHRTAITISP